MNKTLVVTIRLSLFILRLAVIRGILIRTTGGFGATSLVLAVAVLHQFVFGGDGVIAATVVSVITIVCELQPSP